MTKLISILLALVVLACCDDDFSLIGRYGDSDYWIGEVPLLPNGQITATCVAKFGKGSIITSIGNINEWNWLKNWLKTNRACTGCTNLYITSGKWDVVVAANALTTITVNGTTVGTRNYLRTVPNKYICEIPITTTSTTTTTTTTESPYTPSTQDPPANPTPVELCPNDNDVIVLLDSSGSILADNYKKEKVFAYDLARAFENPPKNRFGLTIFSSSVKKIAALDNTFTADELNSRILNADYMEYTTNTHLAIDSAIAEFDASTRTVTKNLVIITDGASNNPSATLASINNAIAKGIRTFSVGIGSATISQELSDLAGGDSSRMFTSANFDELTALLNPLRQVVCN